MRQTVLLVSTAGSCCRGGWSRLAAGGGSRAPRGQHWGCVIPKAAEICSGVLVLLLQGGTDVAPHSALLAKETRKKAGVGPPGQQPETAFPPTPAQSPSPGAGHCSEDFLLFVSVTTFIPTTLCL